MLYRRVLGALVVIALAGCLAAPGPEAAPTTPPATRAPAAAPIAVAPVVEAPDPLLIDVTLDLRERAAEVVVPAGSYRLVRLVYDAAVWGEKEPWDGSAETWTGLVWRAEGNITIMQAFGFAPPSFADPRPIRPFIDFLPGEGDGWVASYTVSSCSGCDGSVPAHELAYLLGGAENDLVYRIGVLGDDDIESLWEREAVPVQWEAETRDMFAGYALRYLFLTEELTYQAGVLTAEWGGMALPTGTSVQRSSHVAANTSAATPGIFSILAGAVETVGAEMWSYRLQTPTASGSWDGPWVHAPESYLLLLTGAANPPLVEYQGNIGAGPVVFEFERSFTGQTDPTGLASFAYEVAMIGHAGIDLDALYGWDTNQTLIPSSGGLDVRRCSVSSAAPLVRLCQDTDSSWLEPVVG